MGRAAASIDRPGVFSESGSAGVAGSGAAQAGRARSCGPAGRAAEGQQPGPRWASARQRPSADKTTERIREGRSSPPI
ncbi:hypothetical protein C884_01757 [Kocuria palustris PEL]|uniref:Uncharacterized protein n=1 Tax=Kocuria palustris PEL TaxID=1236550 RepID=M2YF93_9MICC|nr:hypothetical protein C884_01757 [Kocuria palustris PEL]